MRAIVIRESGGPEVLELRDLPDPVLPFGHVCVRIHFAGVNRADLLQRAGHYPAPKGSPKDIPGLEYAGVVEALGPSTSRFQVGDRVYGIVGGGAYAERVVVHEREASPIPAPLTDEAAGAVPEAFITAFDALVTRGRAQAGDVVLVHAAGSGVGTAAVQIAASIGCTVIGTSRTEAKLDRCRALGLHEGFVPKGNEFADAVKERSSGRGADVVIDLVGGAYASEDVRAAALRGRIVMVGLSAGAHADIDLRLLLAKRLELIGTVLRARPLEEKIEAARALENRLGPLFSKGALLAVVDTVIPLADARKAHERVSGDATFGKVLLDCRRPG